jgi:hypothetical protein
VSDHDGRDFQDASPPNAQLTDLLRLFRRAMELDLRVSAPGQIVVYDPSTQLASVQLGLLAVEVDENGAEVPQAPLVLPQVPVLCYGGSLGYVSTPIIPGDTGFVLFSDRCIDQWLQSGGPVDPISGRTHNLADAVFIPGFRPLPSKVTPPVDLTATVVDGSTFVKLGRNATEFVVTKGTTMATTVAAAVTTLTAVPPATLDPATISTLANANKAAILAIGNALVAAISTKVQGE